MLRLLIALIATACGNTTSNRLPTTSAKPSAIEPCGADTDLHARAQWRQTCWLPKADALGFYPAARFLQDWSLDDICFAHAVSLADGVYSSEKSGTAYAVALLSSKEALEVARRCTNSDKDAPPGRFEMRSRSLLAGHDLKRRLILLSNRTDGVRRLRAALEAKENHNGHLRPLFSRLQAADTWWRVATSPDKYTQLLLGQDKTDMVVRVQSQRRERWLVEI